MKFETIPTLDSWRGPARIWVLGFVVLAGLGLIVSLLMVSHTSGLGPESVATRFAGPESDTVYPHSYGSLLQTTHTHLYTLAFLEFLLGGLFLFSSATHKTKLVLIGSAYGAMLLDHAGMWALFAFGRGFTWMLMVGGVVMTAALAIQILWCAADLLKKRGKAA